MTKVAKHTMNMKALISIFSKKFYVNSTTRIWRHLKLVPGEKSYLKRINLQGKTWIPTLIVADTLCEWALLLSCEKAYAAVYLGKDDEDYEPAMLDQLSAFQSELKGEVIALQFEVLLKNQAGDSCTGNDRAVVIAAEIFLLNRVISRAGSIPKQALICLAHAGIDLTRGLFKRFKRWLGIDSDDDNWKLGH